MIARKAGAIATALALLVTGCGSRAHADSNNAQIDAQLNAVDAATPDGAGRDANAIDLGPNATDVGGAMRSAAAHPPQLR